MLQAAAFPDMVIAVAGKGVAIQTGQACYGRHTEVAPGDITRPVMAAALQSGGKPQAMVFALQCTVS